MSEQSIKHRKYIIGIGLLLLLFSSIRFVHVGARQGADKHHDGEGRLIKVNQRAIRPDDVDTFFYKDVTIRILGIDAPEIIHEEHGIYEDQPYGRQAAQLTMHLLREAKTVECLPFQSDKYGRLLAHVFVDGELLAVHLIRAGLAYETVSFYGDNGFPDLAQRILRAAKESPRPLFEKPYIWRRQHQVRK
jgi:endonuclease YncB( thermonuclease family)